MRSYVLRRLALVTPTLVGVTVVIFAAMRLLPGDIVDQMTAEYHGAISDEDRKAMAARYSLDEPFHRQYLSWMGELARGDLGTSFLSGRSVTSDLRQHVPVSMELGVLAIMLAALVGVPAGVLSAVWQNSTVDYLVRTVAVLGLAIPSFWLALLAIGYGFQWFGWTPPIQYEHLWVDPASNLKIVIVPAVILAAHLIAMTMRLTRSSMLETLREDFVRTARAKGLREQTVVLRHALRVSAAPVVTIIGLQIPIVIGGTVILESIFALPGMGRMLLNSITSRDYPVVQAIVLLSALVVIATNIVVDLAYAVIDPRIKL